MNLHELDLPNCNYILSGIKSPFIEIKGHIPVMHKFCCGTKTAGKTQAATWGSSSKDWAFFRRTQSWKSCLTFSKLMKYSLGFCRNSWSGFGSAAKLTWFSSWIGWIGINLIVKFPLPLDLQYNTGSFKKLDLSYVLHSTWKSATFVIHSFRRCDRAHKTFFISRKKEKENDSNNNNNCGKKSVTPRECIQIYVFLRNIFNTVPGSKNVIKQKREDAVLFD